MSATTHDGLMARPVRADDATLDAYFAQTRSFSQDRLRAAQRSAGIAWALVIGVGVLAGAASFAAAHLAMRPMPDPIVLRVDNTTGIVDRVYDVQGGAMAASEAEQRHWLWQFVLAAEGYSAAEAARNFEVVMLMSAPDVQSVYADRVRGSNPASPQVVLGRTGQATLNWVGTTFVGPGLAQVRFTLTERRGDTVLPRRSMVATVGFTFAKGGISGSAINVNPRGFMVTSYHVDEENPR